MQKDGKRIYSLLSLLAYAKPQILVLLKEGAIFTKTKCLW